MDDKTMVIRVKDYAGWISLAIFILTLAISLVIILTPLYSLTAQVLDLSKKLGMSHEVLMENYYILIQYLNFPWSEQLNMPDFPSSASGLFHFYEVKRLFMINYILLFVSALGSYIYIADIRKRQSYFPLNYFFKWGSIVPFILVILLVVNFDWLFLTFHQLLFNNDAWIFDSATDPIILALPQEFFMVCFAFVFILIELIFISGYFLTKRKIKETRKRTD